VRRLAIFVVRRRWIVIGLALIGVVASGVFGAGVHSRLSPTGFEDPTTESTHARAELAATFPQATLSDFVLVITARHGTVNDPAVVRRANALIRQLRAEPGVAAADSYWSLGRLEQLRSRDSRRALVVSALRGGTDARVRLGGRLAEKYGRSNRDVVILPTGESALTDQIAHQAEKDLQRSELITAPITAIALIIVFGSIVAALLPFSLGAIAVLGTFLVLTVITLFTDVSVFALNLTTALGLGLAIDYSLFVVSRYREELGRGVSSNVAVGRSMQTAGRTVAFSAGTVMISLSALAVFNIPYLRSFAFAGVAVVGLAAVAAIVVLPAVLAVLGPRVEKGRVFKPRPESETGGFWGAQARRVMRHPVPYAVVVSTVLVTLAVPFFHLHLGLTDDRVVPPSVSGRRAVDQIRKDFGSKEANAFAIALPTLDPKRDTTAIEKYGHRIAELPGVERVDTPAGFFLVNQHKVVFAPIALAPALAKRFDPAPGARGAYVSVTPAVEPGSTAGEQLITGIRALDPPFTAHVGGFGARLIDTRESVLSRLPLAIGLVALATFVLLFLMTGSLLVPLKALLLNVLSLTATFGAMVWVFQDGNFRGLLDFTPTGSIDVFTPVLLFCIAFGLSMDYEVFLLSRIKEEYDLHRDNERAVASGLEKTGRIVTAAALLLSIVFVGIATSDVAVVKLFGVGLTLAVLVDAFLIRATLVPAFMRLAGRSNWWAPRWLRRWHLRYGIWENEPIALLDREFDTVK